MFRFLFCYGFDDCEGIGHEFGVVCVVLIVLFFGIRATLVISLINDSFSVRNVCGSCNGELAME